MSPAPGSGASQAGTDQAHSQERRSALRRRLMDISKLLPAFGMLLFAVPMLWPTGEPAQAGDPVAMSSAIRYVFLVWAALITLSFCFSLAVGQWASHWTGKKPRRRRDGSG